MRNSMSVRKESGAEHATGWLNEEKPGTADDVSVMPNVLALPATTLPPVPIRQTRIAFVSRSDLNVPFMVILSLVSLTRISTV